MNRPDIKAFERTVKLQEATTHFPLCEWIRHLEAEKIKLIQDWSKEIANLKEEIKNLTTGRERAKIHLSTAYDLLGSVWQIKRGTKE